jgi:hypothetical protein
MAGPLQSTSRRSIAIHSFVRSPVSAAKTTRGPLIGPNSIASMSISSRVNGMISSERGSGLRPTSAAGLWVI